MTDTELSEIRARCEAATPGPWEALEEDGRVINTDETLMIECFSGGTSSGWENDTIFIAHARTDIPALLTIIDEQLAALAKAEADKAVLVEALEKLDRVGNGISYGNLIAQVALDNVKEEECQKS